MDSDVPYVFSSANVPRILDQIQKAGAPEVFNRDFLKDLGFSSSGDRPMVKVLKYLGMLDASGKPQTAYRDFMDHTRGKKVLAARMRIAFDDLFRSDRSANTKSVEALKGWFKSKTGAGDSVAQKVASTFKALAQYADFSEEPVLPPETAGGEDAPKKFVTEDKAGAKVLPGFSTASMGFVYRIEIHLPDTQNVETFRAIFRALREELIS